MERILSLTFLLARRPILRRIGLLLVCFHAAAALSMAQGNIIGTVTGNGTGGFSGDGGPASSALIHSPYGIAMDASGNLFIADRDNARIRKVTPDGNITTVAGSGSTGFSGDGGPATSARLDFPLGVAVDAAGNIFIADRNNHRVRKVSPEGIISTFAGSASAGFAGDGGSATAARLSLPESVAVDSAGDVFIADTGNSRIRKVTPDGVISTAAGTGTYGFNGDNGLAISAQVSYVSGVAVDAAGNIFIADRDNNRIRKVTPAGVISTVAGSSAGGFGGDGGAATSAKLAAPFGVTVDAAGNLFIADRDNGRVRKVNPDGFITTLAGGGTTSSLGDGGPATSALLSGPRGVATDSAGNVYISDTFNNRIRKVTVILTVPTLTKVAPGILAQGSTIAVALSGTSLFSPLTIGAGPGITVSNIVVTSDIFALATLTIDSNAALGARNLTATTNLGTSGAVVLTVSPPFPDLAITSSHTGNFGVGFNGIYNVGINNIGTAATTGDITVTDNLPAGLTFVSGVGNGWSCSAVVQAVTCAHADSLAAGASTTLALTVAVSAGGASGLSHTPSVAATGDLNAVNNSASDTTIVAPTPSPRFQFTPTALVAGKQSTVGITLQAPFPFEVTGTLTMIFSSSAIIPVDDPAIQFPSGEREVTFTIPANTLLSQFASNSKAGPVGFQTGTVAGTLTFNATIHAGAIETPLSATMEIPSLPPLIQKIQTDSQNGFAAVITMMSTPREVTDLILVFNTTPAVRLSCGSAPGCSTSASTLTFDVRSLFDPWFAADTKFGSLGTLRLPLSIQGTVHGSVAVRLRNSRGTSNAMSFALP